jgi:predicted dehydrogenase/threonine dehydrogenase-like Zn-dependent dehydrogenase
MRQIIQNLKNGSTDLLDIPCPEAKPGYVLIGSSKTLVSVGTERMLVTFGKAGLIEKARSQPDKVKMVVEKISADGIMATFDAVTSKLDQPISLGYCNVGKVLDGSDTGFEIGTRVVSNGSHAEVVRVPKNLVAKIPDNVDDETASFTVIGAIAMQGIRLVSPAVGEAVVVTGLGLIGLLAVQILKASGCRVLGIDFDPIKCELARKYGAEVVDLSKGEDALLAADVFSRGRGVDAVLVTASSKSKDIVHQAATMCRKRGRIVLVGVVGLNLNRDDFYQKELTFQVSCSYGPGRYDENYEEKGNDYPVGFVRWTQQRNFEAVLDLMCNGSIETQSLVSHRFEISAASAAYEQLIDPSSLGIVLDYGKLVPEGLLQSSVELRGTQLTSGRDGNVAFIGSGNYASRVLIPAFKNAGANFTCIVTSGGISAVHHGNKNGFAVAATKVGEALDDRTDTVVIATQHNLHASQTIQALEAGKHVFVEKPLALTHAEISQVERAQSNANTMVMVGYNRRFSPHVQKIKSLLDKKPGPKSIIMTMNVGEIPKEHWTQNSIIGGGRIIGEACHYIDLMRHLVGFRISSYDAVRMGANKYVEVTEDKAIVTLKFEDGSVGSINYFANGGKTFQKERIEVFCDDAVLQLNNFRQLKGFGWKNFRKMNLWRQDKGQIPCAKAFMGAVKEGMNNPIPQDEIFEVARVSVDVAELLRG